MDSTGENTCRKCKGTGSKLYYYPLNKEGVCPHCGGWRELDWITNIIGVRWEVNPPKLTSDEFQRLIIWKGRMELIARHVSKVLAEDCIINKFIKMRELKKEGNTFKWFGDKDE